MYFIYVDYIFDNILHVYYNGIVYGCYGLISVFLKVPDELKVGMKTLKELRRRNVKIVEGPEMKKVTYSRTLVYIFKL